MVSAISIYAASSLVFSSLVTAETYSARQVSSNHPQLRAVTVRPKLQARGVAFTPKRECSHQYAEEVPSLTGRKSRFAKTETNYKLPALVLEDIEEDVRDITCSDSLITVEFSTPQHLESIRPSWDTAGAFLIISSHVGCNPNGERKPHLVSGIHYDNTRATADFTIESIAWEQAYDTMRVKFGSSAGYPASSFRTHEGLRRRAQAATSTVAAAIPFTTGFSTSVDLGRPANASQILNPFANLFKISSTVGSVTESASVDCKNCTLSGTIEIIEGEFVAKARTDPIGKLVQFVEDGSFQVVANNMAATIEIEAKLSLQTAKTFVHQFPEIGVPGFTVPGVATIGPFLRPAVTGSISLQGALDFTYGLALSVPNNSSFVLNFGNLNQSSLQGFPDAKVTSLPFQSISPTITLGLGLGFRAELDLGVVLGSIAPSSAQANVGAFLDLPSINLKISTAPGLDVQCNTIQSNITNATLAGASALLPQSFPSLIKIEPSVVIDFGVQADIGLQIAGFPDPDIGTTTILAKKTFPLPTACLSFDKEKTLLVTPTTTPPPQPTITGESTTSGIKGGPGPSESPGSAGQPGILAQKGAGSKSRDISKNVWWGGIGLLSVFFIALSL